MRITVLSRGGLAVYGGHYDPHRNEAVALVRDDETVPVTIDYQAAPSSPAATVSGLTCSTPAASGQKVTCTLSAMTDGAYADIAATVGGASRIVRIRAKSPAAIDKYECAD